MATELDRLDGAIDYLLVHGMDRMATEVQNAIAEIRELRAWVENSRRTRKCRPSADALEKVLDVMRRANGDILGYYEIARRAGYSVGYATVCLKRLAIDGLVENMRQGDWRAVMDHPSLGLEGGSNAG